MATAAKKPTASRKPAAASKAAAKPGARKAPVRAKDGTFAKKSASHWGTAAIVGGVAAVGAAATAALLRVPRPDPGRFRRRCSTAMARIRPTARISSASFDAGIADEGTIPNRIVA